MDNKAGFETPPLDLNYLEPLTVTVAAPSANCANVSVSKVKSL